MLLAIVPEPVFLDIDMSLQLDLDKVENYLEKSNGDIRAILIPHLHGNVSCLNRLRQIKNNYNIYLIEDCAQAFLAFDQEKNIAGLVGDVSAYSFNAMKVLGGLGDGGAVLFDEENFLHKSYSLRHSGLCSFDKDINTVISRNYRIDAMQSSFLKVRLDFLEKKIEKKRNLAYLYKKNLPKEIKPITQNFENSNHYCFQTLIKKNREELIDFLGNKNVEVRIRHNYLISDQKPYKDCKQINLTNSKKLVNQTLCLPLHHNMNNEDVIKVSNLISDFFKNKN